MLPSERPSLPFELIHEIVQTCLELDLPLNQLLGSNSKAPWSSVSSLSATCKAFRGLVLKAWFEHFYTENPEDTTLLPEKIPQAGKSWVRHIHCVLFDDAYLQPSRPWNLEGYSRLQTVRLDRMSPYDERTLLQKPDDVPFINASSTIVTFDFRGRYWPYPSAYSFIPRCLPSIKSLILYQHQVWCGLCFTVNEVEFGEPVPTRLSYGDGFGLPIHYAKVLQSMPVLEHVSVHIPVFDSGSTSLSQSDNKNMWNGECDSCNELLFSDHTFADEYVSRKQQGIIRLADGTEHRWQRPPSLKSVRWIFYPATGGDARNLFQTDAEISETADTDSASDSGGGHDAIVDSDGEPRLLFCYAFF
ncbi:hypothetical protein AN958_10964 [Leucoagaricus sp. SymC.cos]|nr:hypothetical protein AN958_10964 [Leucoagaricus sp. SymC.cos]